ncbi:NAD-P-binding protein [Schizopora paradoxa]|uniref:NAD-P-binding protein n=1 Tax=Schizopora paradoxa TaxID=27342 RepID=A0A0H2RZ78_9AGAM|nr:NAD-P-binding protein [Schizopora paradoxa]
MSSLESKGLFDVKGKVVLVTGGSRGIGKMIAAGFVRNGAKVYISSRTSKDCDATAKELNALGPGECIPIPADMQKFTEVERLVQEIQSREKMLHVLVNNAGANWADEIDSFPDASFSKVVTLNLQRVFTLTQKCLPLLRAAAEAGGHTGQSWTDPARVIQIGSIDGLNVPVHSTYAYSSSKAALHHLSRHFASKLGPEGITSNTIACGPFQSKMMAQTLATIGDAIVASNPSLRIGTPEDVAGTALFLSSRAGAYVNGATITLDGGASVSAGFSAAPSKL